MALDLSLTATFTFSFEEDGEDGIKYSISSIDHSLLPYEDLTMISDVLNHVEDEKVADILRAHLFNTIRRMEDDMAEDTDTPKEEGETTPEDG